MIALTCMVWSLSNDTATLPIRLPDAKYRKACTTSVAGNTLSGETGLIWPLLNKLTVRCNNLFSTLAPERLSNLSGHHTLTILVYVFPKAPRRDQ